MFEAVLMGQRSIDLNTISYCRSRETLLKATIWTNFALRGYQLVFAGADIFWPELPYTIASSGQSGPWLMCLTRVDMHLDVSRFSGNVGYSVQ